MFRAARIKSCPGQALPCSVTPIHPSTPTKEADVKPLYLFFTLLMSLVLFFGTTGCEDPAETETRNQERTPAEEPDREVPDKVEPAPEVPDKAEPKQDVPGNAESAPETPDRADSAPETEPEPEIPDPANQN